VGGIMLITPTK